MFLVPRCVKTEPPYYTDPEYTVLWWVCLADLKVARLVAAGGKE